MRAFTTPLRERQSQGRRQLERVSLQGAFLAGVFTVIAARVGRFGEWFAELEAAIQEYLNKHNADPKPFVWTAPAASILKKVRRGRQALELVH